MWYIVQLKTASGSWLDVLICSNEQSADDNYYKLAADNKSNSYRILCAKVIKETLENRNV